MVTVNKEMNRNAEEGRKEQKERKPRGKKCEHMRHKYTVRSTVITRKWIVVAVSVVIVTFPVLIEKGSVSAVTLRENVSVCLENIRLSVVIVEVIPSASMDNVRIVAVFAAQVNYANPGK